MKIPFQRRVTALIALSAVLGSPVAAQSRGPDAYAITNARIVPGTGATIPRGTVVIRNGLIVAVGANPSVPADARIVDGAGLTVYPGLIDALTSLALPAPAGGGGGGGRGGGGGGFGPAAPEPAAPSASSQPVGLRPELVVADMLQPGGDAVAAARNAGITTVLTAPREGIFLGQSVLINLAGESPQEMIVQAPVGMHVAFNSLRGGYPGSLLGVFSALRQIFLDAQHYRDAQVMYAKSPLGMRRPAFDPSLAALQPVLSREMPVVFYANSHNEIERALNMAQEFNLRAIIAGGQESQKSAARLKAMNVPVLLTLNLPRRMTPANPDAAPEPMSVLRSRVEAQKTAGALAAAGVRFAFQSGGLASPSDIFANVRREMQNGLTADQALRAFTVAPAEILGVANRLGTIEAGKIANLTITRGDLFGADGRVTQVFIDGRPYMAPATNVAMGGPGGRGGGTAQTAPSAGGIAVGTWQLSFNFGERTSTATLVVAQEGERITGTISSQLGEAPITDGRIGANGNLHFRTSVPLGAQTFEAIFDGSITGTEMTGYAQVEGTGAIPFTGRRTPPPPPENQTSESASPTGARN
jgi:imidazolonepropionase-like amidohydrolase